MEIEGKKEMSMVKMHLKMSFSSVCGISSYLIIKILQPKVKKGVTASATDHLFVVVHFQ